MNQTPVSRQQMQVKAAGAIVSRCIFAKNIKASVNGCEPQPQRVCSKIPAVARAKIHWHRAVA